MLMKNKSGKKGNIFVIVIILVVIGVLIYFGYAQFGSIILAGTNKINCADSGGSSPQMSCFAQGLSATTPYGDKFYLGVNEPTRQDARTGLLCGKLNGLADGECTRIMNDRDLHAVTWDRLSTSSQMSYIADGFNNIFKKQLIIIEGNYDLNGETKYFRTYGLCKESGFDTCEVEIPPEFKEIPYDLRAVPTSITIYYRVGGYSEEDFEFPSEPEEQEVAIIIEEHEQTEEIIEEQKNPIQTSSEEIEKTEETISTSNEYPSNSEPSFEPSGIIRWLTNLWNKFIGWLKR